MPANNLIVVTPDREIASAPHSRCSSFRNRPRPRNLEITLARQRTNSMPNCQVHLQVPGGIDFGGEESKLCRVRSFKTTSKGVINRGDSFKKSNQSLRSTGSARGENDKRVRSPSETSDHSGTHSNTSSSAISYFKVAIIGGSDTGKTALTQQLLTSESMGYEVTTPESEEHETSVSVLLDGEESMMEFIDDPKFAEYLEIRADAFIILFSIIDHPSFVAATNLIRHLRVTIGTDRVIMLVANKTDLVRQRKVTANEARIVAMKYDCKYLEISAALNHHVDELLVGCLSQIRMKLSLPNNSAQSPSHSGNKKKASSSRKALTFLSRLFKRHGRKTMSCDNLFAS
ncbi:GTP-binding protein RAD [Patella vulgata]|uniref:GTP-binding protein RAD n=1 Tax=Patella vulgata TaxID=6465 RepID=UPI0021807C20|nr:GTP-binding protein RAD [Patella vulgata]